MNNKDPFGEHTQAAYRKTLPVLGATFEFTSDSARLLRLATDAYADLPRHRISPRAPRFRIRLQLTSASSFGARREPPQMRTQGDGNLLCGIVDTANFVIVCPELGAGLVSISHELLRFPYHARYELLEFAVFTLASRAMELAPLHAGCVSANGNGVLLIGESGAGKSTLALQAMLHGMDFVAEDAVFVAPDSLMVTGVGNYLHLRADALRFVDRPAIAAHVRKSPVIRRRSGVKKFEVDVRNKKYRLARRAPKIAAVVFVTKKTAAGRAILRPIGSDELLRRFAASQPYAAQLPSGKRLMKQLRHVSAFELKRARHPKQAAQALQGLLRWGQKRP